MKMRKHRRIDIKVDFRIFQKIKSINDDYYDIIQNFILSKNI